MEFVKEESRCHNFETLGNGYGEILGYKVTKVLALLQTHIQSIWDCIDYAPIEA
jgi:hypothetical protein